MQHEGVQPDSLSFVGVLKACASMVVIEEGRCVHQQNKKWQNHCL